jgi:hypothetical protein
MGSNGDDVRGVRVGGGNPKALLLSDGTRLALQENGASGGKPVWIRVGVEDEPDQVSVPEAIGLAGAEYADYVVVRTRAEAAWLELISEWYALEAAKLRGELDGADGEVQVGSFD